MIFCMIFISAVYSVRSVTRTRDVVVLVQHEKYYWFGFQETTCTNFNCCPNINRHQPSRLKMNFRQRMGWLMVILFLSLSALIVYYMFEISETYNGLMLAHVESYTNLLKGNPSSITWRQTITNKLVSLPFWLWVVILLVPYLQVFCLLIACTKNDPLTAGVALAPICLVLRLCMCRTSEPQSNQYGLDVPVHT